MTHPCRSCNLTRPLDADGRCDRCAFVYDVLMAANPVPARRERESLGEARSRIALDFRSRGPSEGVPAPSARAAAE